MSKITIVIESASHQVQLGMALAGGIVTSAAVGDLVQSFEHASRDAERYRGVRDVAVSQGYTKQSFDAETDARLARFGGTKGAK